MHRMFAEKNLTEHFRLSMPIVRKKNTIKLFLAEVIVGDEIQLEETQNLPEPPMKEGTNQKYDSVMGFRHGTFIYCIKDNGRAYPTYVVEFSA